MQTSAIHRRVADFLQDFPPFCYLAEDALERLAGAGRVLFREAGDVIFEEGKPRGPRLFVIQQGGVRISRREAGGETLTDLRGAGEMAGWSESAGSAVYKRSAHAMEDTMLYALDAAVFQRECQTSPRALRFLSLLSSADLAEPEITAEGRPVNWFREPCRLPGEGGEGPLSCAPDRPVREVARRMAGFEDCAMIVVDAAGRPAGICTSFDLRCRVATGEVSVDAPVRDLMTSPVRTVRPGLSVGDSLLEMMRGGVRHLCVTEDGTPASRALEVISEHALIALYGHNPLALLRAVESAESLETLAGLRGRVEGLLRRSMHGWADVDWYCEVVAEIDRALFRRVEFLVRKNHEPSFAAGVKLLLLGTAGRREKLALTETGLAAIAPDERVLPEGRTHLAEVSAALVQCGYARRAAPLPSQAEPGCLTLSQWEKLLCGLVAWPEAQGIHDRLALLDFAPLETGCPEAARLRQVLAEAVAAAPQFPGVLVKDAAAHLPPLTFFEGQAVDEDGKSIGVFDINDRAFWAVSDVARGLAFEFGEVEVRPTLSRLALAGERISGGTEVMEAAGRAVRIILYLRARNAFLHGGEGNVFLPDSLSLADQALLKFSFRAITELLEFVRRHHRLE